MAKKQFKAESRRLLDLMINSIYTNKEIFLREIISNASDAIDKLCYVALTDDKVGLSRGDFKIEITADKDARILTVSDNGIGMDKEELENNLGVIASSGSYKFRQETENKDKKDADIDIIGQFGVGFYSAFMVADEITVITKKYGSDQAYRWQSSGADGYTITECDKESVGTDVIMHIKEDTEDEKYSEYLDGYRLYSLVKKYSDYIRYPIRMMTPVQKAKEGGDPEKPEYEMVEEMTTVNSMIPLWQRKRSEVTDEEYAKFYSELTREFDKPQRVITVSAEGSVTYKALLFVPSKRPLNFNTEDYRKGLQLYSAGVMIMDKCDALLPDYLRFVRGVVDSPDLSLNISRELLQHDRQLRVIAQNLEKKIRADLEKFLKDDREGYEKFYANYGRQIGYGIVSEGGESRKDALKELLMFYSSGEKKLVTLSEYVSRMKEDQKYIYYACGESIEKIDKLPQTELVAEKGAELLKIAHEKNVSFFFEASVGGGIPIIKPLHACLSANEIDEIAGILNGTTNFILTKMIRDGMDFEKALKIAQELGYAERNPSADVDGHDACRKICILASLAFGKHVYPESVHTEGITKITLEDVEYCDSADCKIKLIGCAKREEAGKISIGVFPAVIKDESQLAGVNDVFNAILVRGDATGDVVFYGKGAGKLPTASAVVADIVSAVKHSGTSRSLTWADSAQDFIKDFNDFTCASYIRLSSKNVEVTKAVVKALFGDVTYLSRKNQPENELAFVTGTMSEKATTDAIAKVSDSADLLGRIRVLDY